MPDKTVDINPKTVRVLSEMVGKGVKDAASNVASTVGTAVSTTSKAAFLEATGPYGVLAGAALQKAKGLGGTLGGIRERFRAPEIKEVATDGFDNEQVEGLGNLKEFEMMLGGIRERFRAPEIKEVATDGFDNEQVEGLGNLKEFEMMPDSLEDIKTGTEEQTDVLRQVKEGIFSVDEMLARQFNYTKVQDKLESDRQERARKQIGDKEGKRSLLDRMPFGRGKMPGKGLLGGLGKGMKGLGKGIGLMALLGIGEQTFKGFKEGGLKGGLGGLLGGGEGGLKGAGKGAARGAALGALFGPLGILIGGGIGGILGFLGVDKLVKGFELFKGAMTSVFDWMKSTFDVEKIKAGIGKAFDIVTWLPKKILSFYTKIGDYLFPNMMDALRSLDIGQIFKPVGDFLKEFARGIIEGFISIIPFAGVRESMTKKLEAFIGPEQKDPQGAVVANESVLLKNPLQMTAPKAGYIEIKKVRRGLGEPSSPATGPVGLDDSNIVAAIRGVQDINRKQLAQIERMNKQNQNAEIQITATTTERTVPNQIENSLLFLLNRGEL